MRLRIAVLVHERNEGVDSQPKIALSAEDRVGGISCVSRVSCALFTLLIIAFIYMRLF